MEGMDNSAEDFSLSAYRFMLLHNNLAYFNQSKALPISESHITTMSAVPEWQDDSRRIYRSMLKGGKHNSMREMGMALINELISLASVPDVCQNFSDFSHNFNLETTSLVFKFWFKILFLILYIFHAIALYTQIYYQPAAQYIVFMLLHVSATNSSHLQGAAALEGTCSLLCTMSAINDKLYTCGIIPQLIDNYNNCIEVITCYIRSYTKYCIQTFILRFVMEPRSEIC